MQKISFIAQFPPPIHGLSKAVETLFNSNLNNSFTLNKINITNNKFIIYNILLLLFSKCDLFYFTISQTKFGNLRDLLFFQLIRLKKKKCLIHLHGGYYRTLVDEKCGNWQRKKNYQAISKVDGCIVLSHSLKSIFEGMIDSDKIYIVPNCVDNEFLPDNSSTIQKYNELDENKTINVLYLSNFIEAKGYKEVLMLAKMAKGKNDSLIFHFAGKFFNKEDEDFFFSFIEENKLKNYVIYHGIVSGNTKSDLLRHSHLFILLTRYPNEGQPISILEAMGNSMTIITTNHAGIPDIVQNELSGLVVDKDKIDLNTIYKYIEHIKQNPAKWSEIGNYNYRLIQEKFTEKQYIENVADIFRKTIIIKND